MTAPTTPPPPPPPEDDTATALYAAATVLVLAAIAAAVTQAVTGGASRVAAILGLNRETARVRDRLNRAAPDATRNIVLAAAERGEERATSQLRDLRLRLNPPDDTVADLAADALDHITTVITAVNDSIPATARDAFTRVMDDVDARRITDEALRVEAAQRALARVVANGALSFRDDAGRRWQVRSYLAWNLSQASIEAELNVHSRWLRRSGIDLVYVTTNPVQCRRCRPWEGKILSLTGDGGPATVEARGVEGLREQIPTAGTVAYARAAGLLHPHCYHRLFPWVPGLTLDLYGRDDTGQIADNHRRRIVERHVWEWEQREAAALTPQARRFTAMKLAYWRGQLDERPAPTRTELTLTPV